MKHPTRDQEHIAKRTLEDEKQFRLTIIVTIISAFVLGLAIGFLTGGWAWIARK